MSPIDFTLIREKSGEQSLTLYLPGEPESFEARNDHPNWKRILAKVQEEGSLVGTSEWNRQTKELFKIPETIHKYLSDRVSVLNGQVYFDGDVMANGITKHILEDLESGDDHWKVLVLFLDKLNQNPSENSRKQLYTWLDRYDFTLTTDGDIVGYKSVNKLNGEYLSINSGSALVDGEAQMGQIPNKPGTTITMPRNSVLDDPNQACAVGLHIATFSFAKGFQGDVVMEVHLSPRDVVSVPHNDQKIRCCRYTVIGEITKPYDVTTIPAKVETKRAAKKPELTSTKDAATAAGTPPSMSAFNSAVAEVKKKHSSIRRVMQKKGYKLVSSSSDPKKPESWVK